MELSENVPLAEGQDFGGANEMSHEEQLDALVEQLLGSLETEIDGIVGDYLSGGNDG